MELVSIGLEWKAHAFGVFFDGLQEEVLGHGAGGGAAVVALAGVCALDHDGDGDLRVFGWSEADEPGEVDFFTVRAEVGGAGLSGDAQAGDADEAPGPAGADDALHAFEEE